MALPAYSANSCWAQSHFVIADAIAESLTAQTFLGAISAADAKTKNMWLHSIDRSGTTYTDTTWAAQFPFIIIGSPGEDAGVFVWDWAGSITFKPSGLIELLFGEMPDNADEVGLQDLKFQDKVGKMIEEIAAYTDFAANGFAVQNWGRNAADNENDEGKILLARVLVAWGSEEGE